MNLIKNSKAKSPPVVATRQQNAEVLRDKVRKLKGQGFTYDNIAVKLGISKQIAHYYGRPNPGENCCPFCTRPFDK